MASSPVQAATQVATCGRRQLMVLALIVTAVVVMVLFSSSSTMLDQYRHQIHLPGNISSLVHKFTKKQKEHFDSVNATAFLIHKQNETITEQEHADIVENLFKESAVPNKEADSADGESVNERETENQQDEEEKQSDGEEHEADQKQQTNQGQGVADSDTAQGQDQLPNTGENGQTNTRESQQTNDGENQQISQGQSSTSKPNESDDEKQIEPEPQTDKPVTQHQEQTCHHRDNIALLKMHKCSSSTVQNILFRYGEKYDLTFVMPPSGNYLGYPAPFQKKYAIQVPWNVYNIYTFHSRFSYKGISSMMPAETVFITVVRDPVKMYESTFTYFRLGPRYGLKGANALRDFLEHPDDYFKSSTNKARVKNPMLFDLGLDVTDMYNMNKIDNKIKDLSKIFKLVLISEYFDESLILLKELMCWDLDDIVYFKLNARSSSSVKQVTPDMAAKIKAFNAGDVKFYNYFNETHHKRVKEFGIKRMGEEVSKLQKRIKELKDKCVASMTEVSNRVYKPPGLNVEDFQLKPGMDKDPMCKYMTMPELMFIKHLREQLYAKIRDYTSKHARLL